ncbi:TMV resistance protein N [Spatholobus suberectus]|nr:TMV resistance protein N [Spatholobus suberectus]
MAWPFLCLPPFTSRQIMFYGVIRHFGHHSCCLQEQQLPFIIQENFGGCGSVNEAEGRMVQCNSNGGEDNGENQVRSEKCQPASNDLIMDWDPMELEYQLSYSEGQFVSNDEGTMSDKGRHVMGSESNQSGK